MRVIIAIIISLSLFSCTPQKRLSRLLRQHPELIAHDTTMRIDTTVTVRTEKDTVFKTQITKDTMVIHENNLTIKYFNDGKTTYLKGVCDTIRIIKEVPFIVNSVEAKIVERKWWDKVGEYLNWIILVLLVLILIRR